MSVGLKSSISKSKQIKANQSKPYQIKSNQMNSRPKLKSPIIGNNQFPETLIQVQTPSGSVLYIPNPIPYSFTLIDICFVIDSFLGIYARTRQVDTVFLRRCDENHFVSFIEY